MHLERRLLLKLHDRLARRFIIQLYGLTFRFVVLIFDIANGIFFCIIVIVIIIKVVFLRRVTSATGCLVTPNCSPHHRQCPVDWTYSD